MLLGIELILARSKAGL